MAIRRFVLALMACLAAGPAVSAPEQDPPPTLAEQMAGAQVVSGAEVAARVRRVLQEQGYEADPVIPPGRQFNPCGAPLELTPRNGDDWRTVNVTCPAPVRWSVMVRSGAALPADAAGVPDPVRQVDAAEIVAAVQAKLDAAALDAVPVVNQSRVFYPCAAPLDVAPRIEGDWRTVAVSCPAPARWSLNVRTVARRGPASTTALDSAPRATATDIEAAVRRALSEEGIAATPLVSRLRRFFPCSSELKAAPRFGSDWRTVEVRCSEPLEWAVYVRTVEDAATAADATGAFDVTAAHVEAAVIDLLQAAGLRGEPVIPATRRFYPCSEPLGAEPRNGTDWSMVTVRCTTPFEWSLLVRTNLSSPLPDATAVAALEAEAAEAMPAPAAEANTGEKAADAASSGVVVAALRRSLRKGAVLTEDDVMMIPAPQKASTGLFTSASDVIGRTLTQTLGEGRALHARHLDYDWLVREGNPLMIVNAIGGFEIVTPGRAVGNGQLGDIIEVENVSSGEIIQGVVEGSEKIRPIANMN
jgi:flagella basal body P-ring formation protein FlgA